MTAPVADPPISAARPNRSRALRTVVLALSVALVVTFVIARGRVSDPGAPSQIEVAGAVVAETPTGFAAAVYLTVEQRGGSDRLVGASSPVALRTSLHVMEPMPGGGLMLPTEAIDIPAGGEVALEPFGSHVMLEELVEPLVAGATVPLALEFDRAGDVVVTVEVIDLERLALLVED